MLRKTSSCLYQSFMRRFSSSSFATETISYNKNTELFVPESGPIQNSIYSNKISFPRCRIDQYVWENFSQWQNHTAVVCGITGKSYSYSQLRDSSANFALNLQKFGLKKDDVVAICMMNCPEFMVAGLGILESACIMTTLNPAYTADEIARQLVDSNAKLVICLVENFEVIQRAVRGLRKEIKIICAKMDQSQSIPRGAINFYEWEKSNVVGSSGLKEYEFDLNDTAFLPYSSGTTGTPKGVMLTHKNMISDSEMIEVNTTRFTMQTTETQQEVFVCLLPLFHIYAWNSIFIGKLRLGSKIVTLPNFQPETFINSISKHKASMLHLVPPLVLFLGQSPLVQSKHLSTLRRVMCGAAPLGANDAQAVYDKSPQVIFTQGYGLTESSVLLLADSTKSEFASSGWPLAATQAKVCALNDSHFKALGPNTPGELFFRGPSIMKGYLNNEKATKETLTPDNWLRTGDIGFFDEEGKFFITDRLKELIKVKGFQVAPAELEEILRTHPNIAEAAVVGVSHPKSGEVPRAFVVPKPNKSIKQEEILSFMARKLASYKIPDKIVVVEQIPKNASGKILRRQVKIQNGLLKE